MSNKVNLFNMNSLMIFKHFTSENEGKEIDKLNQNIMMKINLFIYDFLIKLNFKDDEIIEKLQIGIDEMFVINFYFKYLIIDIKNLNLGLDRNKYIKEEKKYLHLHLNHKIKNISEVNTNVEIQKIKELYNSITNLESITNTNLMKIKPYVYFNTPNQTGTINNEIISTLIHVFANYIYIICYRYFKIKFKYLANSMTTKASCSLISKLDLIGDSTLFNHYDEKMIKSLLNNFFKFFKKLNKNHRKFIKNNISIIEVYLNLIVFQITIDNLFLQRNKNIFNKMDIKLVFQILIMFINKNKGNSLLINNFSSIMSFLLINKSYNFLNLLEVFDNSNINLDVCRILIKKLLLSIPNTVNKNVYFTKIIRNLMDIILLKKVKEDNLEGLRSLLLEIFPVFITKFSEDRHFSSILFCEINKNFFKKFGYQLKFIPNGIEIIEKIDLKNLSGRCLITVKQTNYLKFLFSNFNIILKNNFTKLLDCPKIFKIFIQILSKLYHKNKIYYDNIDNQNLKNVQTYISIYFENYCNQILSEYFVKYFTRDVFKNFSKFKQPIGHLKSKIRDYEINEVNEDIDGSQICLNIKYKFITHIEYIEKVSTFEYCQNLINSIENISSIFPFNSLEMTCYILKMFLDKKLNLTNEELIDVELYEEEFNLNQNANENLLLSNNEDKQTFLNNLSKVNNLTGIVKLKILECSMINFTKCQFVDIKNYFNYEEFFELILLLINNTKDDFSDRQSIIEPCLNCILFMLKDEDFKLNYKFKKIIFEIIPILDQIKENNVNIIKEIKNVIDQTSIISHFDLIPETNQKNKKSNINNRIKDLVKVLSDLSSIDNSFEKSLILKESNKFLMKIFDENRKLNDKIEFEEIKLLYNIFSRCFKINSMYNSNLTNIARENLINLFELILSFKDIRHVKFYVNLIHHSIKENIQINNSIEKNYLSFENQTIIKYISLIDKIIVNHKHGSVIFYKEFIELIFDIFDEHFKVLDGSIISSSISVLAMLVNYCGLEMNLYLNTLIKTCINHLSKISEVEIEVKRSSALLLFKIIQNCDFNHFKNFAEQIYLCIKLNLSIITLDKVVQFHLKKCLKLIQTSVKLFYEFNY